MLLPIDFIHSVNVRKARKTYQDIVKVRAQAVVEVLEIAEADAPIVMWVPDEDAREGLVSGRKYPVRYHNGALWRQYPVRADNKQPFTRGEIKEVIVPHINPTEWNNALADLSDATIKEIFQSDHDKILGELMEDVDECALIGEILYVKSQEPHYSLIFNHNSFMVEIAEYEAGRSVFVWRADQFDAMVEFAQHSMGEFDDPHGQQARSIARATASRIDVERPDLLGIDAARISVEKASHDLINALVRNGSDWLHHAGLAAVESFVKLRDLIVNPQESDSDPYPLVANELSRLIEHLTEIPHASIYFDRARFAAQRQQVEWADIEADLSALTIQNSRF